jgi:hypothetical protein
VEEETVGPKAKATRIVRPYSLHGASVDGPVVLSRA